MPTASASWPLWSTTATLVVTDERALEHAAELVGDYLDRVDRAASRFRGDSEILRLEPGPRDEVEVSDVLADLLREALRAARRSAGRVDPTVGTALRRIGYDRDIELVLRDGAPVSAIVHPVPGWQRLSLRGNRLRIPRGVELDLGATAKAVAADRSAGLVAETLGVGVLVSLGGDIATAGPAPEGDWQVVVQDRPEDEMSRVVLGPGDALATSSTVSRAWSRGGRRLHHIIDPATGLPASSPWRSVTVAAASCAEANTVSTAALVRGADAIEWITTLGLPSRLLGHDGEVVTLNAWSRTAA